jgi:hypothetical protein
MRSNYGPFPKDQLKALGLTNYVIDMLLKAGTITPGTPGTNTGPNEMPLIGKIGAASGIALGWVNGASTLGSLKLKDRGAVVIKNNQILNSKDLGDGEPFFTKNLADTFVTLSINAADGETYIIIIV